MANEKKTSAQQIELAIRAKIRDTILEVITPNEWNIVSLFWSDTSLYLDHKIDPMHFSDNTARVYYIIGSEIVKEGKSRITDIEAGLYLQKHNKLKKVFEEAGGYNTISELSTFINPENIDGYINEFNKYYTLLQLNEHGWLSVDKIKSFIDMSLDEIYDYYNARLNDLFIKANTGIKSYDISDDIDTMIEEADKGMVMGLPLHGVPMLSNQIGGWRKGEITMLGGVSNAGKSTTTLEMTMPSIIEHNEKMIWIANESGLKKTQRELLTWVVNNIFHHNFSKERFKFGKFTEEEKMWLKEGSDYIKEMKLNRTITFIPLERYHVDHVIKLIRKYSALGVDYVVLDTFKPSTDSTDIINDLVKDSVKMYDTIKETGTNSALWLTVQLNADSINKRYLTMNNVGKSKQINEVMSTIILFRNMFMEEKFGGSKYLKVTNKLTDTSKHEVKIDPTEMNKKYPVFFAVKVREGNTGEDYQIVAESDLGRNKIKELGICSVPNDSF